MSFGTLKLINMIWNGDFLRGCHQETLEKMAQTGCNVRTWKIQRHKNKPTNQIALAFHMGMFEHFEKTPLNH